MTTSAICAPAEKLYAQAVVLRREGDKVELAVTRQNTCTACAQSKKCGAKQETGRAQRVWLATDIPLKTGETVAVSMPDQEVWRAAILMYGLPLAGFVLGLLMGAMFNDVTAMVMALSGLIGGFVQAGRLSRNVSSSLQLFQQAPAPFSTPKNGEMTHD